MGITLPALGTNQIAGFVEYRPLMNWEKDKEKYQSRDELVDLIKILSTNITRTVWQTVRRITNEILGVKGLNNHLPFTPQHQYAHSPYCSLYTP